MHIPDAHPLVSPTLKASTSRPEANTQTANENDESGNAPLKQLHKPQQSPKQSAHCRRKRLSTEQHYTDQEISLTTTDLYPLKTITADGMDPTQL